MRMSFKFGQRRNEEFEPDFSDEEDDRELTQRSDGDTATSPRGTASKSETSETQANLEIPLAENSSKANVPPATGLHPMSCHGSLNSLCSLNAFVASTASPKPYWAGFKFGRSATMVCSVDSRRFVRMPSRCFKLVCMVKAMVFAVYLMRPVLTVLPSYQMLEPDDTSSAGTRQNWRRSRDNCNTSNPSTPLSCHSAYIRLFMRL